VNVNNINMQRGGSRFKGQRWNFLASTSADAFAGAGDPPVSADKA
jgi:hypothetical protein